MQNLCKCKERKGKMYKKESVKQPDLVLGVDVSWINQLEAQGFIWKNKNGNTTEPIKELKDMGANAVRLRVFVNPPESAIWEKPEKYAYGRKFGDEECMLGFCDSQHILEMAKRVKQLEMKLMIDFHYSDHFADPIYQDIPAQWENDDCEKLKQRVEAHTKEVLQLLKENDITPDWVQVGNEINSGILLPKGSIADAPQYFIDLFNTGYKAVKELCPDTQVVAHISGGNDLQACIRFFDRFFEYGGKTDILGFSYYPYWVSIDHDGEKLLDTLSEMSDKYNKPVMIAEIGGHESQETETYEMLLNTMQVMKNVPKNQGLGIFYWEPEAYSGILPDGYPLGAACLVEDKALSFTKAMSAYGSDID